MRPIANIADIRERARRKLPRPIFDWVDGGSFDERTLRANSQDFAKLRFRQRALVDVSQRSTATTILGQTSSMPLVISPSGLVPRLHDFDRFKRRAVGYRIRI